MKRPDRPIQLKTENKTLADGQRAVIFRFEHGGKLYGNSASWRPDEPEEVRRYRTNQALAATRRDWRRACRAARSSGVQT